MRERLQGMWDCGMTILSEQFIQPVLVSHPSELCKGKENKI
jgi:hypothetical protein